MSRFLLLLVTLVFAAVSIAAADGNGHIVVLAQVSSPPEVCTEVYQPVCGTDQNGKRTTYSNACFARIAKATNIKPGECPRSE
ncbi:MAG: kazal domain protein [Alphaproteobacteria bacterium]|nr:MAG: kazal domain protein [Alphaproteobacteria bacterium]